MAPMQRLGTRVAMLAAVGIMLAGCSGGGGTTPATGGMGGTPDPGAGGGMEPPGAGAAAARADFFPISGAVLANGTRAYTEEEVRAARVNPEDVPDSSIIVSQGSTFQNLVLQPWIDRNFIQFSDFEFGAATDNDGIMLSKASAQQANRYNAIAYQGVLEHSMFLFQGASTTTPFLREIPPAKSAAFPFRSALRPKALSSPGPGKALRSRPNMTARPFHGPALR